MARPSGARLLGSGLQRLQPRALQHLNETTELTPSQVRSLTERMKVTRFTKGQIIYDGHQPESRVYFISSGIARLTCLNRDGERLLLEVLAPGDVLSIPSLLPDVRHTLQCEAFTECRVGMIAPEELLESIMRLHLPAFRAALRLTTGRWWQLLLRHSRFLGQTLEDRILLVLLDLAAKFGVQNDRGTILNVRLRHRDIAELVGGSRARVSAYLERLAAQGALVQEGHRIRIVGNKLQAALLNDSERLTYEEHEHPVEASARVQLRRTGKPPSNSAHRQT